ncbi:hypothetical protein SEUCBS140593_006883 [Sporothrix eucalyptigena]|uniref:Alpha/beta hydrolase fold-3 domain-containing protein n=1 Tax=Sporothrix eucalyptigena TaxID=1812306 RepID=A0ABP0C8I6_9PEZI
MLTDVYVQVSAWISDVDNLYNALPALKQSGVVTDPIKGGFLRNGPSAGGNIAAVIAGTLVAPPEKQEALLAGLPRFKAHLTGVFAAVPLLTTEEPVPENYLPLMRCRKENADSPNLKRTVIHSMVAMYGADVHSPWFTPLMLNDGTGENVFVAANHAPKVFLQVCSQECLRDDGIIYRNWLRAAGNVDVRLVKMEGHGHSAWVTPVMTSPEHREELEKVTLEGMAWLLDKEWDGNTDGVY